MVDEQMLLNVLTVLILVFAATLLLVASAAFGRQLSDLAYQRAAHINGVRIIQSKINLREHSNRLLIAVSFLTIAVLALFDVNVVWRTWIGRSLLIVCIVAFTTNSVKDWIDEQRQIITLMDEDRTIGLTYLRLKGHSFANKLGLIVGLIELHKASNQPVVLNENELKELEAISTEVTQDFQEIQKLIRSLDPTYKPMGVEYASHSSSDSQKQLPGHSGSTHS